jgi:ElaB/YqjD/DUF883 family membrane-anchored ribosome-binding protein
MAQTRGSRNSDNPTTDHLASMAHDTIDRVAETANHAEREVRTAAKSAAAQARDMQDQAMEAADDNIRKARSYIEDNPFASAAIAFVAGIVLSTFIRR